MKRVLVAVLDWGLGHAARSVAVVRTLQQAGCEVLLAGSGDSLLLLRKEFPDLKWFLLPGYAPRYPRRGSMVRTMAMQLPRFIKVIVSEHREIERIIVREKIALIISDNRYGCWSAKVHSVFITHQSNILMPKRFGWLRYFVRAANNRLINRFHSCWIPDFPEAASLAGALTWQGIALKNAPRFIGWLSRFVPQHTASKAYDYDVLAIFSGPEPQRSLLEQTVVPQLRRSGLKYKVVRGLPSLKDDGGDETVINFLGAHDLQACIEAANLVIARSGYSTVMDMQALGKRAVFIPTPGQTEQEYLANRLMKEGIAFCMNQDAFQLETALRESRAYTGFSGSAENNLLRDAVSSVLDAIS